MSRSGQDDIDLKAEQRAEEIYSEIMDHFNGKIEELEEKIVDEDDFGDYKEEELDEIIEMNEEYRERLENLENRKSSVEDDHALVDNPSMNDYKFIEKYSKFNFDE